MQKSFKIKDDVESIRLDKYLAEELSVSRNQIEKFIKNGNVLINGDKILKRSHKIEGNDSIDVHFPEVDKSASQYEINFDIPILYEDEYLIVLNKPANVVVHSAPSVKEATIVDWLKKRGVSLSTISGEERHGIVHRLDKGTTGAMVIAKDNNTHKFLSAQLEDRTMGRYYLAVINIPLKDDITVEAPLARDNKNRLKMSVADIDRGKYAKTFFKKYTKSIDEKEEIVFCKLFTGRTHQIRAHLATLTRHVIGDEMYGFRRNKDNMNHLLLHAHTIYFKHPATGKILHIEAEIHGEMLKHLNKNFKLDLTNDKINNIHNYFNNN